MPPASAASFGPVEPWLAMDENLFVRRVSGQFSRLARRPAGNCVGQPIFEVLAKLGVGARALDEVFDLVTAGQTCFVELPRDSFGKRHELYALEIRPIPAQAGWVIRYVAIAWRLEHTAPADQPSPPPPASSLEFPGFEGPFSRSERPGSERSRRPDSG